MTPNERSRKYRQTEKGKTTMRLAARRAYQRDPIKAAFGRSVSQANFMGFEPPHITLEQYRILVLSHKGCEICGAGAGTRLCLDHDHVSGFVRGMLCRRCNTAVGLLDDNIGRLKSVLRYLENAAIIETGK